MNEESTILRIKKTTRTVIREARRAESRRQISIMLIISSAAVFAAYAFGIL
jgi:hypothetical protein